MSVRIHEAGHHNPAMAVNDFSLQTHGVALQRTGGANLEDRLALCQHAAVRNDPQVTKLATTSWRGCAREGQQLRGIAKE
jgi:hypothetical protein